MSEEKTVPFNRPPSIRGEATLLTYRKEIAPNQAFDVNVKFHRGPVGDYSHLTIQFYGNQAPEITFDREELAEFTDWFYAVSLRFLRLTTPIIETPEHEEDITTGGGEACPPAE